MPSSHRKRNVLLVALFVLVLFITYQFIALSKPASFVYTLDSGVYRLYPNENNAINITCTNSGAKSASFYLVLKLENASFSPQTEQPYIQENSTKVKFPFTLHKGDSTVKPVFFLINDNVTVFSFSLSFEEVKQSAVYGESIYYYASYKWNETVKCYEQWILGRPITYRIFLRTQTKSNA